MHCYYLRHSCGVSLGVLVHLHVYLPLLQRETSFCDFLFAFLDNKTIQTGVTSESKEFAPKGANSFLEELTPNEKVGKK